MRAIVLTVGVGLISLLLSCGALGQSSGSNASKTSVTDRGLVADLYLPPHPAGRLPAIVLLGGSEGGLSAGAAHEAQLIAEHGYAVLQVACFGAPGLPKLLGLIPLEYFKTAIDWLQAQPLVDPSRVGIVGTSIGAEAALIVAAHNPEIRVVVVGSPSSVVWPGIDQSNPNPPSSWSLGDQAVPDLPYGWTGSFTSEFALYADGLKALDAHPDAVIPVERINGPILMVCGEADTLWPSCPMADLILARLTERHFKPRVRVLAYADAGHVAFGPQVEITEQTTKTLSSLGGSARGNASARANSWPEALSFLDDSLKP
jgi:uncharacterized protein